MQRFIVNCAKAISGLHFSMSVAFDNLSKVDVVCR